MCISQLPHCPSWQAHWHSKVMSFRPHVICWGKDDEFSQTERLKPWQSQAKDLEDYIFFHRSASTTKAAAESSGESAEESTSEEACPDERISLWTWRTCGLPIGGFILAFLNATVTGVSYGFFLGYMGLDSNVLMSITSLMKLPQVFLLPFGLINDCVPICGYNRKPYFVASFMVCSGALLSMSLRPLPDPYYCQDPDGWYDNLLPPCNPAMHAEKNWYVWPMFLLVTGVQMGCVAGEGLLLEYSQSEPLECRGKMKAEFTIVTMAGSLLSSAVIGVCMNGKEYLGTFDWSMSFNGLMMLCFIISTALILISVMCTYEPPKVERPSFRAHIESSWKLWHAPRAIGFSLTTARRL